MLKRLWVVSISAILLVGILFSPATAFAAGKDDKTTPKSKRVLSQKKAKLVGNTGTEYTVNLYETCDTLVSVDKTSNTSNYVKEYAFVLDEANMALAVSGSKSTDEWDSTGTVEGTIKVYYSRNGTDYKITRTTGTWRIYGSGTGIRKRHVIIVCNEGFMTDQYISEDIFSGSFDISTGFTQYADSTQGLVYIGAKSTCEIYRLSSGTKWQFEVECLIAGSIPSI